MRARLVASLCIFVPACVIPPVEIGETATQTEGSGDSSEGTSPGPGTTSEASTSEASTSEASTSEETSSSEESTTGANAGPAELDWQIPLPLEAAALEIEPGDTPVIAFAELDVLPEIQRFTTDGALAGTPETIAVPLVWDETHPIAFGDFAVASNGLGVLLLRRGPMFEVHGLTDTLVEGSWATPNDPLFVEALCLQNFVLGGLQAAADGTARMACTYFLATEDAAQSMSIGILFTDTGEVPLHHAFGFGFGLELDAKPFRIISDPDDAMLVGWQEWGSNTSGWSTYELVENGEPIASSNEIDFIGVTRLPGAPAPEGWVQAGAANETGGLWVTQLEFVFSPTGLPVAIVPSPPVFDVPDPAVSRPWPIYRTVTTAVCVWVFTRELLNDANTLSARQYDFDGNLLGILPIPPVAESFLSADVLDVATATDGSVYVLGVDTAVDGTETKWLARLSPSAP